MGIDPSLRIYTKAYTIKSIQGGDSVEIEDLSYSWKEKLDNRVEDWHNGKTSYENLEDALGFTEEEYAMWVTSPDNLQFWHLDEERGEVTYVWLRRNKNLK